VGKGIQLFKYVCAGPKGKWERVTSAARPSFYDALEDSTSSGKKSDWFLEVGTESTDKDSWLFTRAQCIRMR